MTLFMSCVVLALFAQRITRIPPPYGRLYLSEKATRSGFLARR
jgi:hypothetical protein